jgi:hypothetical protein
LMKVENTSWCKYVYIFILLSCLDLLLWFFWLHIHCGDYELFWANNNQLCTLTDRKEYINRIKLYLLNYVVSFADVSRHANNYSYLLIVIGYLATLFSLLILVMCFYNHCVWKTNYYKILCKYCTCERDIFLPKILQLWILKYLQKWRKKHSSRKTQQKDNVYNKTMNHTHCINS